QEASKQLIVLSHRCEAIGSAIAVLGRAIGDHPETVTITGENVTYPKYAGAPAFERNRDTRATLPITDYSLDNLKDLVDEYKEALKAKMDCLEKLHALGVNLETLTK
ncbi:MAG: hypothetical protein JRN15_20105, partial [Nitrososphaerota archaeon]|nr:hypothetical protein [Nitrososphaerota archaeon]